MVPREGVIALQKRRLIYNTALLTLTSLLMSCIGMAFQVWLVNRIGSAGIGLYQLVVSVSNLCFKQVYLSPMREFWTMVCATSARPTNITILLALVTAV
jgi:hypothetical protein